MCRENSIYCNYTYIHCYILISTKVYYNVVRPYRGISLLGTVEGKQKILLQILMVGDFNCALNPKFDRRNNIALNVKVPDAGHLEIQDIINENNMTDIWRRRYPRCRK